MRYANRLLLIAGLALVCQPGLATERPPKIGVTVRVNGSEKFSAVLPVMKLLKQEEIPASFEISADPGITATLRIRSDVQLVAREDLRKRKPAAGKPGDSIRFLMTKEAVTEFEARLRKNGVSAVKRRSVAILDTADFSVSAVKQLRRENRHLLIVSHADWDVPSQKIHQLILDPDVIKARKDSGTVVMIVDRTHPLLEEKRKFFSELKALTPCVIEFKPGSKQPAVTNRLLESNELVRLLK